MALLSSSAVVKVLHAVRNDVRKLYGMCGGEFLHRVQKSVFDTQDGFEAVQGGYQRPLEEVVERVLCRALTKDDRLRVNTRWQKSVLTDEEVAYAVGDAYHLPSLFFHLAYWMSRTVVQVNTYESPHVHRNLLDDFYAAFKRFGGF